MNRFQMIFCIAGLVTLFSACTHQHPQSEVYVSENDGSGETIDIVETDRAHDHTYEIEIDEDENLVVTSIDGKKPIKKENNLIGSLKDLGKNEQVDKLSIKTFDLTIVQKGQEDEKEYDRRIVKKRSSVCHKHEISGYLRCHGHISGNTCHYHQPITCHQH